MTLLNIESEFQMQVSRTIKATVLAAGLLALYGTVCAQTNPLYEHRRSLGAALGVQSVLTGAVRSTTPDGRVVLDAPSARLIEEGVKSGDPVEIELGTQAIRAYVGFNDEVERSKSYYAEMQRQLPVTPGVTVIVNRYNPAAPIVLDSSAWGTVINGQQVVFRYVRSRGRMDSKAK